MAEKILMMALSPTMEEGTIVRWNRKEGDAVKSGDLLCEVETDKATMEYESPASGTLLKVIVPEGAGARVADPIAIVGKEGEDISQLLEEAKEAAGGDGRQAPRGEAGGESEQPGEGAYAGGAGPVRSSPLARNLARQRGIDLGLVEGSGPAGRIIKRDIDSYAGGRAGASVSSGAEISPSLVDELVPVSGKRKIIAQRLSESKFQAPHYYLKLSIFMDGVLEAREALNSRRKGKVSLNAFIMKLAAEALKRHPEVNASWMGDKIRRFGRIDMALAVAVPDGLMTPVVRSCGAKGILEIHEELNGLIEKTREGKLLPEDYSDATFTVTNLGSFGIEEFTAIINPPGSAILALGKIQRQIVLPDEVTPAAGSDGWKDQLELKSVLKATLSCDHRVVDGAVGAAFLADLKEMMENPISALY